MFGGGSSIQLFRVLGIRVGADVSFFLVVGLFLVLLNDDLQAVLAVSSTTAFAASLLVAVVFFGSIFVHELGHGLAARTVGLRPTKIELFLFGGAASFDREPPTPGAEFVTSGGGPAATLVLMLVGIVAGGIGSLDELADAATLSYASTQSLGQVLLGYLAGINALLLAFNLLPAFPLDGGRLARAGIWKATGSRLTATRVTAVLGQILGYGMVALGLLLLFRTGDSFGGIWLAVLGFLIASSARAGIAQGTVQAKLEGVTVADVMDRQPVWVPADATAAQVFDEFFLRYWGSSWFPVLEPDGRFVGVAHRAAIEAVANSSDAGTPVRRLLDPGAGRMSADASIEDALRSEELRAGTPVVALDDAGVLRGTVSWEQVTRTLQDRLAPQSG